MIVEDERIDKLELLGSAEAIRQAATLTYKRLKAAVADLAPETDPQPAS